MIQAAHQNGIDKLLLLGASYIYPKLATQPMKETELLTGTLEPTNEPYALAKLQVLNSVNLTIANMIETIDPSCRQIYTTPMTTFTLRNPMLSLR